MKTSSTMAKKSVFSKKLLLKIIHFRVGYVGVQLQTALWNQRITCWRAQKVPEKLNTNKSFHRQKLKILSAILGPIAGFYIAKKKYSY